MRKKSWIVCWEQCKSFECNILSDFPNTRIFTKDFYLCTCYYFARNGLNTTLEDHHNTSALLNISGSAQVYTCKEKFRGVNYSSDLESLPMPDLKIFPKSLDIIFHFFAQHTSIFRPYCIFFSPFSFFPLLFPSFSSLFISPLEKLLISSWNHQ